MTEIAQPLWAAGPLLGCPHREKKCLVTASMNLSFFQLMLIVCCPPTMLSEVRCTEGIEYLGTLGQACLYLLVNLLIGTGRLLLGPFKTFFSPGWISPSPLVSAHSASAAAPNRLGGPPLNLLQFINIFPVLWGPDLNNVLQEWSREE